MDKYIILFDVDGTLTHRGEQNVAKTILESIKMAKQKGHIVAISTGRSLKNTLALQGCEVFDYIVCLMGTEVYDVKQQKVVYQYPEHMKNEYIKPLIEYLISTGKEWTYKDCYEDKTTYNVGKYGGRFNAVQVGRAEVENDLKNNNIMQLLAIEGVITSDMIDRYSELDFIKMPPDYYDILKKGQNKGVAIKYFKKCYPGYKTVAVGDSFNDIGMFETCDISIAMGNSVDAIKKMTTYVTKSIDDDGVPYALKHILKI